MENGKRNTVIPPRHRLREGRILGSFEKFEKRLQEIVELAGEVKKLAKRLHPRDEEAAELHAIDAFLSALERPLAVEVQKLGYHTMESVVAADRRIEKILAEQTDSETERLMHDEIRLLKKDLKDASEQIASLHCSSRSTASSRSSSTTSPCTRSPLLPGIS